MELLGSQMNSEAAAETPSTALLQSNVQRSDNLARQMAAAPSDELTDHEDPTMCENSSDAAKREKSMRIRNRVSHAVGKAVLARHAEEEALMDRVVTSTEELTGIDIDGNGVVGHSQAGPRSRSLGDVLTAVTVSRRAHLFHDIREDEEQKEAIAKKYWLSNQLLHYAVVQRDGPKSWEARVVSFLQSRPLQILLIVLLLLDVLIVFAELFLETEHPSCKVLRRSAYSCCPMPGDAVTTVESLADHHGALHNRGCDASSAATHAYEVGCAKAEWAHRLHEMFSVSSLIILFVFQMEIMALMASFRGLFLRSKGYLLDVVVVSLSLSLQWYVLMVELGISDPLGLAHAAAEAAASSGLTPEESKAAAEAEHLATIEELQSVILFARCWRFIRVGHGIATSMQDMKHAAKV